MKSLSNSPFTRLFYFTINILLSIKNLMTSNLESLNSLNFGYLKLASDYLHKIIDQRYIYNLFDITLVI